MCGNIGYYFIFTINKKKILVSKWNKLNLIENLSEENRNLYHAYYVHSKASYKETHAMSPHEFKNFSK